MGTLLLQQPAVYLYLLYVGGLWAVFILASWRKPSARRDGYRRRLAPYRPDDASA
jgi:hypothetical protein